MRRRARLRPDGARGPARAARARDRAGGHGPRGWRRRRPGAGAPAVEHAGARAGDHRDPLRPRPGHGDRPEAESASVPGPGPGDALHEGERRHEAAPSPRPAPPPRGAAGRQQGDHRARRRERASRGQRGCGAHERPRGRARGRRRSCCAQRRRSASSPSRRPARGLGQVCRAPRPTSHADRVGGCATSVLGDAVPGGTVRLGTTSRRASGDAASSDDSATAGRQGMPAVSNDLVRRRRRARRVPPERRRSCASTAHVPRSRGGQRRCEQRTRARAPPGARRRRTRHGATLPTRSTPGRSAGTEEPKAPGNRARTVSRDHRPRRARAERVAAHQNPVPVDADRLEERGRSAQGATHIRDCLGGAPPPSPAGPLGHAAPGREGASVEEGASHGPAPNAAVPRVVEPHPRHHAGRRHRRRTVGRSCATVSVRWSTRATSCFRTPGSDRMSDDPGTPDRATRSGSAASWTTTAPRHRRDRRGSAGRQRRDRGRDDRAAHGLGDRWPARGRRLEPAGCGS